MRRMVGGFLGALLTTQVPPATHERPLRPRAVRPTRRAEYRYWREGRRVVAGADEVGRGPLAGPLVVGAVVLRPYSRPGWLRNLRDSKALSAAARRALVPLIEADALAWATGWVVPTEIDRLGMTAALRLAYRRALERLPAEPEVVVADGRDRLDLPWPTEMIVGGDARVATISAASVIAKEARDAYMAVLDGRYPGYGFAHNKGYATRFHQRALRRNGPCPAHRQLFAPVRTAAQQLLWPEDD